MRHEELVDLNAFLTVAEEHSFTRRVSSTEAGERLLATAGAGLHEHVAKVV